MLKTDPSPLSQTIIALKNGDRSAFERVYNSFGPKLYAFTKKLVRNKEDADEIVQEVFLKIWERRHFLDPEQNFDGYLFRIARNLVYNKAKHQVYEVAYSKYLIGNKSVADNDTEESIYYQDLNHIVEEAYTALPPVRKQVFVMSRIEGLSNSEIADRLHTSNSNIENHINKALRDIRLKLKGYKLIHFVILTFFSSF
ncbi:RNA polymerase sigma-70 factor [Rhodocytophaga rosea]|uniref:RNA polymerase sigma-70 factor n=1 Tax=Rhodocytophaga rosea TaxID=2704465 RepID=A0A6C0GCK9_9BACT|nr:RNA polymerase sigma-70 factor [Rhodocytophaga rosea]QHT65695.1 RNA polymerase sigma-70 factor [Rhodocytophaga rosea]